MDLLSTDDLQTVFSALKDVRDTFFKQNVVLRKRVTGVDTYGEHPVSTTSDKPLVALFEYSVGESGRYKNVAKSDMGQRGQETWRLYFWKADLDAQNIVIDSEADCILFSDGPYAGKEYEIRMATPSAQFSDLGTLLWEVELEWVE